jgi:hypothetical protein
MVISLLNSHSRECHKVHGAYFSDKNYSQIYKRRSASSFNAALSQLQEPVGLQRIGQRIQGSSAPCTKAAARGLQRVIYTYAAQFCSTSSEKILSLYERGHLMDTQIHRQWHSNRILELFNPHFSITRGIHV